MIEAVPPPFVPRPDWFDHAACKGTDVNLFFPDVGVSPSEALLVCAGCDVAAECRAYAVANGERNGVWGGETVRQRRKLAARRHPSHGRVSAYNDGCRCGPCTEAASRYRSEYRALRLVDGGAA